MRHLFCILFLSGIVCSYSNGQSHLDTTLSIEKRVELLMKQMTLQEKVAQLCSYNVRKLTLSDEGAKKTKEKTEDEYLQHGIGTIENTFDPRKPEESVQLTNGLQQKLLDNTRLKIPAMVDSECLHGHTGYNSTIFPTPIAMACSWNTNLIEKAFDVVGREARARGSHEAHTPVLDLGRDPRWGRIEETYGEDSYLTSTIGMSAVAGMQGGWTGNPGNTHIVSTIKHFAGYGQVDGGRNFAPTHFSPKVLFDEILPPFKAAIQKSNAQGVMASHCEIDGVPAHGNKWLLTDLLRDKWGFKGIVVSDYNDIKRLEEFHKVVGTVAEAAELGLKAGMDLDLPIGATFSLLDSLANAKPELIPYIDRSVRRILTIKFKLGLFENPFANAEKANAFVGNAEHRQLSKTVADECVVLLKNKNQLLPLKIENIKSIAVIGPNANSYATGVYSAKTDFSSSILNGISDYVGNNVKVNYHQGCIIAKEYRNEKGEKIVEELPFEAEKKSISEAVRLAKKSDVTILCVGGDVFESVEAVYANGHTGDRSDLNLLGNQEQLALNILKTGKPVVLVLMGGKPYSIPEIADKAPAILSTFYLGESNGKTVADILFGKVNPSGKLSISFPRSVGQLPMYYSQKANGFFKNYITEKTTPLFAFGHGLSYTTFQYSDMKIFNSRISDKDTLRFECRIKNTGSVVGKEVVQVYFKDRVATVTRPAKLLVRFEKLALNPGETKTVRFEIYPNEDLSFTGIDMKRITEKGFFDLMIGSASNDIKLQDSFELY